MADKVAEKNEKAVKKLKEVNAKLDKLTDLVETLAIKFNNMSTVGGKKKKAKKDPNAPKKAKNGYMFYCQEFRSEVSKEKDEAGNQIKSTEVVKRLAKRWSSEKNDVKAKYEKMAVADKERYEKESKEYNEKKKQ